MQNEMRGPHARTAVRGSITSFPMPAEAIMESLQAAIDNSAMIPIPHDGKVLSIMVRLHLAGNVSMKHHLKELEIRAEVVVQLIRELIARGFPGYENYNIGEVERRTRELLETVPGPALCRRRCWKRSRDRRMQEDPGDRHGTRALRRPSRQVWTRKISFRRRGLRS